MGIRMLPITLSFLVQIRLFLYRDAQEIIIYHVGCITNLSTRQARPSRGARKGVETSKIKKKDLPIGEGFW